MDNLILGNRHSDYVPDLYSRSEDAEIKMEACPDCYGDGTIDYSFCCDKPVWNGACSGCDKPSEFETEKCAKCDGSGEVEA
jgi:DnaJ-class molecular chaperone